MLGAFEPVLDLYSSLDAKHIQHDTIGLVVYTLNNEQSATPVWGSDIWNILILAAKLFLVLSFLDEIITYHDSLKNSRIYICQHYVVMLKIA